jgi:hypothetical protein
MSRVDVVHGAIEERRQYLDRIASRAISFRRIHQPDKARGEQFNLWPFAAKDRTTPGDSAADRIGTAGSTISHDPRRAAVRL